MADAKPAGGGKKIAGVKPATAAIVLVGAIGVGWLLFRGKGGSAGKAKAGAPAAGGSRTVGSSQTIYSMGRESFTRWHVQHHGHPRKREHHKRKHRPGPGRGGQHGRACPSGFYYVPALPPLLPHPEGATRHQGGGWCVPNRDKHLPQPGG